MEESNRIQYGNLWFHSDTPREVIKTIGQFWNGTRIRIFLGDITTGKCWNDEYGVTGKIGRSTGTQKIPLLINNQRSKGGDAILTRCIVGICTTEGVWLYKHPTLDLGEWTSGPSPLSDYHTSVYCNGRIHANFKTQKQADNYIGFMTGKRFCK